MEEKIFIKYLSNRCTPEECEQVIGWLKEEAHTDRGKDFLGKIWQDHEMHETHHDTDFETILDKIHHRINILDRPGKGKTRGHPDHLKLSGSLYRYRFVRTVASIAAILLIPLIPLTIILSLQNGWAGLGGREDATTYSEVVSPMGSRTRIELPDSSIVWLNSGSGITYPRKFRGKYREVILSGQAYFEVASNSRRPFVVNAADIGVMATGTEFGVSSYQDDPDIEVVLKSGEVSIVKSQANRGYRHVLKMKPDQCALYSRDSEGIKVRSGDIYKYLSWVDDKLVFRNDPLPVVARKLSRWYNVDIEITSPELSEFFYTATFIDETLPQVLELLKLATPIDYTISSRTKLENGMYSRRKVEIRLKK